MEVKPPELFLGGGGHGRIAAPAAQHLSFGASGLQRFDRRNRFDQHAVLQRTVGLRIDCGAGHPLLQDHSDRQHHGDAHDRHHDQPAGNQCDQGQEDEHEADVDQKHDGGRSEEVPYAFIFADPLGKGAGAALALGHWQVHHLFKQLLRIFIVELAADFIDKL